MIVSRTGHVLVVGPRKANLLDGAVGEGGGAADRLVLAAGLAEKLDAQVLGRGTDGLDGFRRFASGFGGGGRVRRRIAQFETRIEAMRMNGLRYLTRQLKGEPLSSETSVNKLLRAALEVDMGDLAVELQGHAGSLTRGADPVAADGRWQQMALSWPEVVIGGGTPNIQRNIIAERILGLPKD